MKQQFSEVSDQRVLSSLRRGVQEGTLQITVGVGTIALVVLAGISGALFTEQLDAGDPSEKYQPPHNALLQALLYHPPSRIDTVRRTDNMGPLQMGGSSMEEDISGTESDGEESVSESQKPIPRITSRPSYTAVSGQTYEYDIKTDAPGADLTFQLQKRPTGMSIESGILKWTPREIVDREVAVAVFSDEGRGTEQSFTVHVSNTSYPFGTEEQGRGMGAALILGARWAVLPGCIAVLVSMILGILVGGLAGYYEGYVQMSFSYLSSVMEALPSLVIFFLAAVIFQRNIYWIMGVVGLLRFPRVAASIKSKVQSLKARQFVEASRELGLRDHVILWRDIVWYNARPHLLLQAAYGFVFAIIIEVTLSYLRLGIEYPSISWGNLLFTGREQLMSQASQMYWPIVLPVLAIIFAISAFYLTADGIARRYNIEGG